MNLKTLLRLFIVQNQCIKDFFRIMKISLFLLFVCLAQVFAVNTKAQNAIIKLETDVLSVGQLINQIEKQTDYLVVFRNQEVNTNRIVTLRKKSDKIGAYLDEVFKNTDVVYEIDNKYILLYRKNNGTKSEEVVQQAEKKITGVVLDQNGEPIIGANVIEKGTTNGVVTGVDGDFILNVSGNAVLMVSFIGYDTQELPVGSKTQFTIRLKESSEMLSEVVVTALGIKREEKALGYAVQKVSGEKVSTIKSTDFATALTGKVSGLNVKNSSEFNTAPAISLRGETPLVVVDGVPYEKIYLRDIASDDIESIDVLKGATASALYGSRGGAGAIMITTKRGKEEGLHIQINSSTMFDAGFLRIPEVQSSYSTGMNGKYNPENHIWGDKLDIGRTAVQLDPVTKEWREMPLVSKGKNNFRNFLELSFVTNNNINITQKGKYGSFRTSLTHVYNKGQYPNTKLNKITYTVAGDMKYENFSLEGGITYNKRFYPNNYGTGYGRGGYIYNLLVWTGADIDIREHKNYWKVKDEEESWPNSVWFDNPYFIANEIKHSSDYNITNAFANAGYQITPWLKVSLRSGAEVYSEGETWRNPISARGGWHKKGFYREKDTQGFSINNDLILTADYKIGDFTVDGLFGGTISYYQNKYMDAQTQNGISIPGYYSLKASVDPVKLSSVINKKQVNSLYGKASVAYKSILFLDVTARNDWSSSLPAETRSYFYPSVSGSFVVSEVIPMPTGINFWKLRASWTKTKQDLKIYEANQAYSISSNMWDGMNGATYPESMKDPFIKPSATRTYELGTAVNFWNNRIRLDVAYYNKLYYNLTYKAPLSETSGFATSLINIDEEQVRKGVEVSIGADLIQNKDFSWYSQFNWALDRLTYSKIDPVYSSKRDWVAEGKRVDHYTYNDWERDPAGNIIHSNGNPIQSKYLSVAGYTQPDWIMGFTNTFKYKDFTLNISIDGRFGGVAQSVTNQALWMTGAHIDSDTKWRYDEVVNGMISYVGEGVKVVSGTVDRDANGNILRDDRVFAPNDVVTSYEGYMKIYNGAGNVWSAKHQHILDQTFIKLRELSLTYDIPKALCHKLRLDGASVSFIGSNLLMWTKEFKYSDPDVSSDNLNSPSLRMLGCNVKLNF